MGVGFLIIDLQVNISNGTHSNPETVEFYVAFRGFLVFLVSYTM